jgi:hypothetical protein
MGEVGCGGATYHAALFFVNKFWKNGKTTLFLSTSLPPLLPYSSTPRLPTSFAEGINHRVHIIA